MVPQGQRIDLRPLTRWLVSAAQAGYGRPEANGLGWRLPDEFGATFAGGVSRGTLDLFCAPQEAAWLQIATGFAPHGKEVAFLFGDILFFLPVPAGIELAGVEQIAIHGSEFPFPVLKSLVKASLGPVKGVPRGPAFIFRSW